MNKMKHKLPTTTPSLIVAMSHRLTKENCQEAFKAGIKACRQRGPSKNNNGDTRGPLEYAGEPMRWDYWFSFLCEDQDNDKLLIEAIDSGNQLMSYWMFHGIDGYKEKRAEQSTLSYTLFKKYTETVLKPGIQAQGVMGYLMDPFVQHMIMGTHRNMFLSDLVLRQIINELANKYNNLTVEEAVLNVYARVVRRDYRPIIAAANSFNDLKYAGKGELHEYLKLGEYSYE